MRDVLLVFLGGGAGSVLRWFTGLAALKAFGPAFPYGTLIVNVLGCFAMGLLFRALPIIDGGVHEARLLLMTGVLGGFTTFSAFALDSAALWMRDESGASTLYVLATLAGTLLAVAAGLAAGKWVSA